MKLAAPKTSVISLAVSVSRPLNLVGSALCAGIAVDGLFRIEPAEWPMCSIRDGHFLIHGLATPFQHIHHYAISGCYTDSAGISMAIADAVKLLTTLTGTIYGQQRIWSFLEATGPKAIALSVEARKRAITADEWLELLTESEEAK